MDEPSREILETVFSTYKSLKSYLIDLDPDSVERFHEIPPIDSDAFFTYFWYCKEDFLQLRRNQCTLIFIPDDPAIQKEEFEKHSVFLSSFYAKNCKKAAPVSLEAYITHYDNKDLPFFFKTKSNDMEERMQAIQKALSNPHYQLRQFYDNEMVKRELAKVFTATKEKGYCYNKKDIFSNQALAVLLGRLLKDGGETGEKIFYYLCGSETKAPRIVHLYHTVLNLLNLPNTSKLSPRMGFTLLVFCHFRPFSNSSPIAERISYRYDSYPLFENSYYQSEHFLKNLDKRIDQIANYNRLSTPMQNHAQTLKAEHQLRQIKSFLASGNAIEQMNLSFKSFIEYIDKNWDSGLCTHFT